MKKKIVFALFITSIIIANVVAGKIIMLGNFVLPAAVVAYAFTFLMTDVTSEIWGKKEANRLVFIGFICSVFASGLIFLASKLPAAPFALEQNAAFNVILGLNWKFMLASMTAYYVSQTWDVWMFHVIGKLTKGKHKWARNNISTMTSQVLDTAIFITIAFYGLVPNIWAMILSQYIFKVGLATIDTPIFYLITRKVKQEEFTK